MCSWFFLGRSSYPHLSPEETCADTSHSGLVDDPLFWRNSCTVNNVCFINLLVNKSLQAWSSVLNKVFLEYSIITSERHLSFESFAGKRRHNNLKEEENSDHQKSLPNFPYSCIAHLAVPFQFISQPLKVGISSTNARLLHPENRKICLQS